MIIFFKPFHFLLPSQLSKNLGVTATTKRLSNMAISDLLNASREFPVDRDAYRYLDRYVLFFYLTDRALPTNRQHC